RLNTAYFTELGLPLQATLEQRRTDFVVRVRSGLWWGAFDDDYELVSIASINATYGSLAQVGGVYTRPTHRREGLSLAGVQLLIEGWPTRARIQKGVPVTGGGHPGGRKVLGAVGIPVGGRFRLLLGERRLNARAPEQHKWAGQSGEMYTYEVYDWPARLTPGP